MNKTLRPDALPMTPKQIGPFLRSTIASGERLTLNDVRNIETALRAVPEAGSRCPATQQTETWGLMWCGLFAGHEPRDHVWFSEDQRAAVPEAGSRGLDVEALRPLSDAATPGPWSQEYVEWAVRHIARNVDMPDWFPDDVQGWTYHDRTTGEVTHPDASLIVAAVNWLRAALADTQDAPEAPHDYNPHPNPFNENGDFLEADNPTTTLTPTKKDA